MQVKEIKEMFIALSDEMVNKQDELCKLDSYVGDGDHGITVARGFKEVKNVLLKKDFTLPKEIFKNVGDTLALSMGGAIGPILGSLFNAGYKQFSESLDYDVPEFAFVFEKGLDRIQLIGGAKVGDRTMVDAISPAVESMKNSVLLRDSLKTCFSKAALAAQKGKEGTKDLVAKKGRAKFLQSKSKGYVDAGATTSYYIIKFMSNYMEANL
jgi:dihydroxyacetone kinase phosphoprotein-dependent L subunit